jgi:hypothetical protein
MALENFNDSMGYTPLPSPPSPQPYFAKSPIENNRKSCCAQIDKGDLFKVILFFSIMGGASAIGAYLFWYNVILLSLIPNATIRQPVAISIGAFFFFSTAFLVGWPYWTAIHKTSTPFAFFVIASMLSVFGSFGLVFGFDYFIFHYNRFVDTHHKLAPHTITWATVASLTTIAYLILAMTQKYMEYWLETHTQNNAESLASNSEISNTALQTKGVSLSSVLLKKSSLSQFVGQYINNDDPNNYDDRVIIGKYWSINLYSFFAIFFGTLNAFIGGISGYAFANSVFTNDVRFHLLGAHFCISAFSIQISYAVISAFLTMVFFTKDMLGLTRKYYYKNLEAEGIVVLKENADLENAINILTHLSNVKPPTEAARSGSRFLSNQTIKESIKKEKESSHCLFNTDKKLNSFFNGLVLFGLLYQFVGLFYLVIPLHNLPLSIFSSLVVLGACYLKRDNLIKEQENPINDLDERYQQLSQKLVTC